MEQTETTLTQAEIVQAATNDPSLAEKFTLGDREFALVDLEYADYITFLSKLEPLLKSFASRLTGVQDYIGGEFNIGDIFKYCADSIPEMACIVCRQTDSEITVEEVKRLGKSPFAIAAVVLKQINKNKMIAEIGSFFAQVLPILNAARRTT